MVWWFCNEFFQWINDPADWVLSPETGTHQNGKWIMMRLWIGSPSIGGPTNEYEYALIRLGIPRRTPSSLLRWKKKRRENLLFFKSKPKFSFLFHNDGPQRLVTKEKRMNSEGVYLARFSFSPLFFFLAIFWAKEPAPLNCQFFGAVFCAVSRCFNSFYTLFTG